MNDEKKENGFKRFLRTVFVKNWQYKLFSLACGVFFWILVVGLL